jgi:hypothetical protein
MPEVMCVKQVVAFDNNGKFIGTWYEDDEDDEDEEDEEEE